jgi:hypothetical protein
LRHAVAGGGGLVDLGKSIYLQPSFSAPLMFFGGLLFGYGMVMSNGCGSRALVLLGRGNLRSFCCRDRARHRRADDAEGPDRAGAHRHGAGVADHGDCEFGAGVLSRPGSSEVAAAWWRRRSIARR